MEYICKIATLDEMNKKWNYEIEHNDDKSNWIIWKKKYIDRFNKGLIIPYYGILGDKIICECTAVIDASVVNDNNILVNDNTAYLMAFRTITKYQGKGYFSKLFSYMLEDLKNRGYKKVTIGVEPLEVNNKEIYKHLGFTEYIGKSNNVYPVGTIIDVEYYYKML